VSTQKVSAFLIFQISELGMLNLYYVYKECIRFPFVVHPGTVKRNLIAWEVILGICLSTRHFENEDDAYEVLRRPSIALKFFCLCLGYLQW
jgi:hypothetical protein